MRSSARRLDGEDSRQRQPPNAVALVFELGRASLPYHEIKRPPKTTTDRNGLGGVMQNRIVWILLILAGSPLCARAQWLHHPLPGTPRTPDGKPDLAAPAPRAPDGKPDLSGIWRAESSPIPELIGLLSGGITVIRRHPWIGRIRSLEVLYQYPRRLQA